ncbi:MAG: hypothetical protein MZV65_21545 [Chromatiales bacterium]|nr:hypothetical protein [Chromatiales bacterium]MCK7578024.1 hypothetical protein [Chromatiales bacterium]MCK7578071.1 hypothetical protein [Chromatiales bacterium]
MIPLPGTQEAAPETSRRNYEAVRFNAMKHGILSKLTVLAHEDRAEFDELFAALIEEHQLSGMTEQHLVEELAAIMWRKQRVLLAEGAAINQGLHSVVHSQYDSPISSAAPFESGLTREGVNLPDLLTAGAEDIAERRRQAELDLAATRKAASILRKGGLRAYECQATRRFAPLTTSGIAPGLINFPTCSGREPRPSAEDRCGACRAAGNCRPGS